MMTNRMHKSQMEGVMGNRDAFEVHVLAYLTANSKFYG